MRKTGLASGLALVLLFLMGCSNRNEFVIKNYLPEDIRALNENQELMQKNRVRTQYTYLVNDTLPTGQELICTKEYDTNGLLISTENKTVKTNYGYDAQHRLSTSQEVDKDFSLPSNNTVRYHYDRLNNLHLIENNFMRNMYRHTNIRYRYYGNLIKMEETEVGSLRLQSESTTYVSSESQLLESDVYSYVKGGGEWKTRHEYSPTHRLTRMAYTGNITDSTRYIYTTGGQLREEVHYWAEGHSAHTVYEYSPNGLPKKSHRIHHNTQDKQVDTLGQYVYSYEFYP